MIKCNSFELERKILHICFPIYIIITKLFFFRYNFCGMDSLMRIVHKRHFNLSLMMLVIEIVHFGRHTKTHTTIPVLQFNLMK